MNLIHLQIVLLGYNLHNRDVDISDVLEEHEKSRTERILGCLHRKRLESPSRGQRHLLLDKTNRLCLCLETTDGSEIHEDCWKVKGTRVQRPCVFNFRLKELYKRGRVCSAEGLC